MILDGTTGARWTASSTPTLRPSPATSSSWWRTTSTTFPSSTIRRVSRKVPGRAIGCSSSWLGGGAVSAGCGEVRATVLAGDLGIDRRAVGLRETIYRGVEPVVDLARADRVLVLPVA